MSGCDIESGTGVKQMASAARQRYGMSHEACMYIQEQSLRFLGVYGGGSADPGSAVFVISPNGSATTIHVYTADPRGRTFRKDMRIGENGGGQRYETHCHFFPEGDPDAPEIDLIE